MRSCSAGGTGKAAPSEDDRVIDLVWFLRCLSDEERDKADALLRAIQDRRWREIA